MNPVEWATQKITFDEATALVGKFDIQKYRFLEKPLLEIDNIATKRLTIYKASSAGGTIFLQIALAFWLDQRPGGIQVAMQSDESADEWMKTRGKKWINRIPCLKSAMSSDKYAATNSLYQWPHAWLLLTGPGQNAQQSKQVRFFVSDESHTDAFKPGSLAAFEERMGKRWQRMGLHVSTAADAGREIDQFYYSGGQNEFHLCCPKCNNLIWPLWEEDSKRQYNGHKVFQFSETSTSPTLVCPFCLASYEDTARHRRALHDGSDYVCKNPDRSPDNQSYRWNCFGAWFMDWAGHLAKYRESIDAAKMGDLKPHEDWIKKRLCQSYEATMPDIGDGNGSSDAVFWIRESAIQERLKTAAFDVQSGTEGTGFHLWGQIDEFLRDGSSQRIAYEKIESWNSAHQYFKDHAVKSLDTYIDAGHRTREVFAKCEEWGCYAMFSTDDSSFLHDKENPAGPSKPRIQVALPYSKYTLEDAFAGQKRPKRRWKELPAGYCHSMRWSKPVLGGYLMALKAGQSHYYGIPKDFNPEYVAQLNSYAFTRVPDKKYGGFETIIKQVKIQDHSFGTSSTCILGALIRGFFPLALTQQQPTENAA